MNSKTLIKLWQKRLQIQKCSLLKMTDKLKSSRQNWMPNTWLMDVESGNAGKLQKGLITSKHCIGWEISSTMNWTIDLCHDQSQTSEIHKTKIKETIQILNEIKEKLTKVCVGANYGKAAGNGAEILGAGGAIIGAVMCLHGLPSGPDIVNIGSLVHHGGTIIDNASKVIESRFSEKYLKEIRAILNEDREISETLGKWLEYTKELDASVKIIYGVSQIKKWNIVAKSYSELYKLASSGAGMKEALNLMKQGKYSLNIGNDVQITLLEKLFDRMTASPLLANKIRSALSVLSVKPEYMQALIPILIASCSLQELFPSLYSEGDPQDDPEITTAREVTYFCIFRAIRIAYSYISLMDAASIIKRGESQYSDALKGFVRALNRELK